MALESVCDITDETYAQLLQCSVDVRSYIRLVDRLAGELGGGRDACVRAGKLIYEYFLDAPPAERETPPPWFDGWIVESANKNLVENVAKGLSRIVRDVSSSNEESEGCFIDEGWAYDSNVDMLNEVVEKGIKDMV